MAPDETVDFFVSYTARDREWAAWIAWQLEDAGYTVLLQDWDFRVGARFVAEMDAASRRAGRTIAVLSPAYLESTVAAAEWQEAWRRDPDGQRRRLLPVLIEPCDPGGLLGQIVWADLVGLDRAAARDVLLSAAENARLKPAAEPAFPGAASAEPDFPADPDRIRLARPDALSAQYICYVARDRLDSLYHQVDIEVLAHPGKAHPIGRLSFGNPAAAVEDPRSARTAVMRLITVRDHLDRTGQVGDLAAVLSTRGRFEHAWYLVSTEFEVDRWDPASANVDLEGEVGGYRLRLGCAKQNFSGLGREPEQYVPTSANRYLFEDRIALPMHGLVRIVSVRPERALVLGSPLYLVLNPLNVDLGAFNDVVL